MAGHTGQPEKWGLSVSTLKTLSLCHADEGSEYDSDFFFSPSFCFALRSSGLLIQLLSFPIPFYFLLILTDEDLQTHVLHTELSLSLLS